MGSQKIVKLTDIEDIYASNILTNVSSFNSGLTSGDTTVQLALNDIDTKIGTLNNKLNIIQFEVDGIGFPLISGTKTPYIYVPFDCTITGWDILCSSGDTFSVDILYNSTFSNTPTSITSGGTSPNVSGTSYNSSSSVSGWNTTSLLKGGIMTLNIVGTPLTATWLSLKLRVI